MSGMVFTLEKDALDENITIETLAREAYLVAKKLKQTEFEEWINQELNGYTKAIPEYRNIAGELKAWNPYNGWIPVLLPAKLANSFSQMPVGMSVLSLLDEYNSDKNGAAMSIGAELTELLNNNTDFIPTKFIYFVSKSEIYRIISSVRNKILDWAYLPEENGIVGNDDMTFTDEEKKIAAETNVINNYINNFYANVSEIDLNQGK